jgi:hypothetical protein
MKNYFKRYFEQVYLRGRYAYSGDRIPSGATAYLYEGYSGANLGDEMIFDTVSGMLMPFRARFVGRWPTPCEMGHDFITKRKSATLVLGGGTIAPSLLSTYLRNSNVLSYALGIGCVGYVNDSTALDIPWRNMWEVMFQKSDVRFLGVRGPYSANVLQALGQKPIMMGDTALSCFNFLEHDQLKGSIALNFGHHDPDVSSEKLKFYCGLLEVVGKYNRPIVLVPFHEQDIKVIKLVMDNIKDTKVCRAGVKMITFVPSLQQLRSLLPTFSYVLGERLHCGIAALASGIPAILLSYRAKHLDFAASVGAESMVFNCDSRELKSISEAVALIEGSQCKLQLSIKHEINKLRNLQRDVFNGIIDDFEGRDEPLKLLLKTRG